MPDPAPPPKVRRTIADRYELLALLGSGGMGRVYRGYDTRLKRDVAIKTLNAAGAKANARLMQEAQAQAKVEHPNVCRIYEVGWDEHGEPFIVMQLLEGSTLAEVAGKLSIEQRVAAVLAVAEGVHEAHRCGVIHRDLKPGNILMEAQPDGSYKAFVTDFGLARDATDSLESRTGSVVGTPQYMAPEQARGDTAHIDRRSDVYGVGAILYEVLCGEAPFQGSAFEILNHVLEGSPVPLRKRDPDIPRDLAVIAGKCMEREPARRYDSARALAEDLQSWLDGTAISARPPGPGYLLRRWASRHRPVAIGLPLAVLALGIGASWILQARARAHTLAARFGQDVKEIEGFMRFAQGLPLHDTSAEEAQVRARMARLEREMLPLGVEGAGPGNYALGRGHLALGNAEEARKDFQAAWDAGYQTPETATGLGLSLVRLYAAGLREAGRIEDKTLAQLRRKELEKTYRAPALLALREGYGATTEPIEYVSALVLFFDDDLDGAEKMAREAIVQAPWLYDAQLLLGSIHRERGRQRRTAGDDSGARLEFGAAREPLQLAAQFGRSDARVWSELCTLWIDLVGLTGARSEIRPKELFGACSSAIAVAPGRAEHWVLLASAHRAWAEVVGRTSPEEERRELEEAMAATRHALEIAPASAEARLVQGTVLARSARVEERRGRDPGPILDRAIETLQRGLEAQPESVELRARLGATLADRAELLFEDGRDPSGSLGRSLELLGKAVALAPEVRGLQAELARVHQLRARWLDERGQDPREELSSAARAWQASITESGGSELVGFAAAHLAQVDWELDRGLDCASSLEWAGGALERTALAGFHVLSASARGGLHLQRARQEFFSGRDPERECAEARRAFGEALDPRDASPEARLGATRVELLSAQASLGPRPEDAKASLERARSLLRPLLVARRGKREAAVLRAGLETLAGRALASQGTAPLAAFTVAEQALAAGPATGAQVAFERADLLLSRAEWLQRKARPFDDEVRGIHGVFDPLEPALKDGPLWRPLLRRLGELGKRAPARVQSAPHPD